MGCFAIAKDRPCADFTTAARIGALVSRQPPPAGPLSAVRP
jgi:hypothetical protein